MYAINLLPPRFNAAKRCINYDAICPPNARPNATSPELLFVQPSPGAFQQYTPPHPVPTGYVAPQQYYWNGYTYQPWTAGDAPPVTRPMMSPVFPGSPVDQSPHMFDGLELYQLVSPGLYRRWAPPATAAYDAAPNVTLYVRDEDTGIFQTFWTTEPSTSPLVTPRPSLLGGDANVTSDASAISDAPLQASPAADGSGAGASSMTNVYGTPTPTPQLYTLDASTGAYVEYRAASEASSYLPRWAEWL